MPELSIQVRHARTGQVDGCDPYGSPRISLSPSWSVFDRRIVTTSPSAFSATSSMSRATSSLRRSAPAKADQYECSISHVDETVTERRDERGDHFRTGSPNLARRNAFFAPNPCPY
jgi:hypothetical protein